METAEADPERERSDRSEEMGHPFMNDVQAELIMSSPREVEECLAG
jgi:hypothetical protein